MPPVDPQAAVKAELWRWHLGRVLVHEFSKLARRAAAAPDERQSRGRSDDGREDGRVRWQRFRWQRVRPFRKPELGLAALKHHEQQRRHAEMVHDFRKAEAAADTLLTDAASRAACSTDRGRRRQAARFRK